MFRLVIVSGLSGSGKSVALNMLEDLGWFCIDNIPAGLLENLVAHTLRDEEPVYRGAAACAAKWSTSTPRIIHC